MSSEFWFLLRSAHVCMYITERPSPLFKLRHDHMLPLALYFQVPIFTYALRAYRAICQYCKSRRLGRKDRRKEYNPLGAGIRGSLEVGQRKNGACRVVVITHALCMSNPSS
jgi:hypothetical protein